MNTAFDVIMIAAAIALTIFSVYWVKEGCVGGVVTAGKILVVRNVGRSKLIVGLCQHRPNRFYYKAVLTPA